MKGSLFPRLAFSPDETHASWAGRLAAFHMGGGVTAFLNDMRIPKIAYLRGYPEFVEQLCNIADQDVGPVLQNTILRTSATQYSLKEEVFGSGFLVGKLTKFCPACLLDDDQKGSRPHTQRREQLAWCFRSVLVCPVHHIYFSSAPIQRVWRTDFSKRVPICTDVLRLLVDRSVPAPPSPVQTYLLDRLAGVPGPKWLGGQSIEQATRSTEMLGAVLEFGYKASTNRLTNAEWHLAGCTGWEWTRRGKIGLREAFHIVQASAPKATDARLRPPGHRFGTLYEWLAKQNTHDDRGPMRNVLRAHILETEPVTTKRKLLGKMVNPNGVSFSKESS